MGEPGVGWPPEEPGLLLSLSPLDHFPWSNRGLSRPSGDAAEVRRGRPFDLFASWRLVRGPRRLAAHPHQGQAENASALCTSTSPKPIASGNPGGRNPPSAAMRSRSASSGTGTSPKRFAASLTARSGRIPPRRRSRTIDRVVASAPRTRWASTSRTRQPVHQDAEFHAVSSSDSIRSANWRRRRATSGRISTVSTNLECCKSTRRTARAYPRTQGRSDTPHAGRHPYGPDTILAVSADSTLESGARGPPPPLRIDAGEGTVTLYLAILTVRPEGT